MPDTKRTVTLERLQTLMNLAYEELASKDELEELADSLAQEFVTNEPYELGDWVWYGGLLWRFKAPHAAGAWDLTQVDMVPLADAVKGNAHLLAVFAQNVGQVESDMVECQSSVQEIWDAMDDYTSSVADSRTLQRQLWDDMIAAGLRRLNGPNLLKQNWWTTSSGVDREVVYGRASRIAGSSCMYLTSIAYPTKYELESAPTSAQLAEASAYYTFTEEVDGQNVTRYWLFKDEDDIKASVVSLPAAAQVAELDGELYTRAIQFDVTANSAYGNTEWLLSGDPSGSRTYTQGASNVRNWNQVEEMQPGETYSMSFWARVLSGEGAMMRCGYGNSYTNQPIHLDDGRSDVSDWIQVTGSDWTRYDWTFTFNPPGDWYTETTATENDVTTVTRTYNWFKKVGFAIARKYTATVQVCGFRLVHGPLWLPDAGLLMTQYNTLMDQYTALEARVAALEGQ